MKEVTYREAGAFSIGYLLGGFTMAALIMFFSVQANGKVINLDTPAKVKVELAKPGPMILFYGTTWCPGCTILQPKYEALSKKMKNVRFLYMDSDKIGLKEHKGMVQYIPFLVVGKDEKHLRNSPCKEPDDLERSEVGIRKFIEECLK